ncbi:MAG: GTPase Era [Permianibacter sp.]
MTQKCGYVAIVGRPNVGKSTLMNRLIGQKISITSRRPQTTRHRILGIHTEGDTQILFVDTPGLHKQEARAINRYMNRAAASSVADVDAIIWVVDGLTFNEDDELVLERLKDAEAPVLLFVNKVDTIHPKEQLLPHLAILGKKRDFAEIVPGSAKSDRNVDTLLKVLSKYIPENEHIFGPEEVTDRSQRFLAAEFIREKLMRSLGAELPYATTVEIEQFKHDEAGRAEIHAVIFVERPGQKAIVIGEKGERIKQIGQDARLDMEKLFGCKVFLELWVKVKDGWADDERALRSLGYTEE